MFGPGLEDGFRVDGGGAEAQGSLEFFEFGLAKGASHKVAAVGFVKDACKGLDVGATVIGDGSVQRSNCAEAPVFSVD